MKRNSVVLITELSKGDRFYKAGSSKKVFEYSHSTETHFHFFPTRGEHVITSDEKRGKTPYSVVYLRSTIG